MVNPGKDFLSVYKDFAVLVGPIDLLLNIRTYRGVHNRKLLWGLVRKFWESGMQREIELIPGPFDPKDGYGDIYHYDKLGTVKFFL